MVQKNISLKDKAAESGDFETLLSAVGKDRDRKAFIRLFEHFAPRIKSFMIKGGLSPEEADEIAQETMLNVWNRAESYDPQKAAASTWIFTIARNRKIDALRKKNRMGPAVDLENIALADQNPGAQKELTAQQESEAIAKAFESLPEEQRSLVYKSFFESKSHGEIAEETGIALGTVKSRIRLALERLRGSQDIKDLR